MRERRGFSKQTLVMDASVMIKLIAQEDGIETPLEKAVQKLSSDILDNMFDIVSSPLLCWEVGSWASRAFPQQALQIISSLPIFGIQEHRLSLEVSSLTFEIMRKCPHVSFYDASYHGLAMYLNATFLTNDTAYHREAHSFGHIKLLKDY